VSLARAHRQSTRVASDRKRARAEGEFDQRVLPLHEVLAQTQEQHRQFFTNVARQGDDHSRSRGVIDGCCGQRLDEGAVKSIVVLRVEVIARENSAHEALPGEGPFVREGRAANGPDAVRRRRGVLQD
jgi:hypothetical protein